VIGFSINHENRAYETIQRSNIPVVYNGDWTEETPLGKAEWIKFFAPFFQKEKEADRIFSSIEENYNNAKALAQKAKNRPKVLSGALYKDIWYLPGGKSWASKFIEDANAEYLWYDTSSTGSLSLSLESVIERGRDADFWISPSQFGSYSALREANQHYVQFSAFRNRKIYTYANSKGETGGLLFFELAPNRPDLVLKDLIQIFHPELLPNYMPTFFKPLD
jgi:iron complex transport system substrate-binding protein